MQKTVLIKLLLLFKSAFKTFILLQNRIITCNFIESKNSLYSTSCSAEACNEFAGSISALLRLLETQLLSKKCLSGGEPLTKLRLICPVRDLNLRSSATEKTRYCSTNWPVLQLYYKTKCVNLLTQALLLNLLTSR